MRQSVARAIQCVRAVRACGDVRVGEAKDRELAKLGAERL